MGEAIVDVIPFAEALEPVARRSLARLRSGAPNGQDVPEPALSALVADLARQLSDVSATLLHEGFAATRDYDGYVAGLLGGGWRTLLRDHPELERLVDLLADSWVESSSELLARLSEDRSLIAAAFGGSTPPGRVTQIVPGLSDRHDRGRSVCAVGFASGLTVVYKPRDVGIEAAFGELVGWLNERGLDPPLRAPRTLERDGYGWAEFIPAAGCADGAAAGRFYRRAGALVCLMDVLGATDMHHGNLVACGEHPVLVDLETLFHPVAVRCPRWSGEAASSVLATGLAPAWTQAPDARGYDVSGLGAVSPRATRVTRVGWSRANSDDMALVREPIPIARLANAPSLDGRHLSPADYAAEILAGFGDAHRFLARRSADVLGPSGPLRAMAGRETRVLVRHTLTYRRLIGATLGASSLRDGRRRHDELARRLAPALLPGASISADAGLDAPRLEAEAQALLRLDIPRFTTRPDAVFLEADGGRIEGWSQEPGFARAARRLARLDDDRDASVRLLKTTLDLAGLERLMNPA